MTKSILDSFITRKAGLCSCCGGTVETESYRVATDDGFCRSAFTVYVCTSCDDEPVYLGDAMFHKLGNEMFYEDYFVLKPVHNMKHFKWLVEERKLSEYLDGARFSDDRYEDDSYC